MCRKVYKYVNLMYFFFFGVDRFLTYGQSSNFRDWMAGVKSMHLHHEGSMIGVQCQLMIGRGHIRASKGTFEIFLWLTVLWQIDILVQCCTLVFILSQI